MARHGVEPWAFPRSRPADGAPNSVDRWMARRVLAAVRGAPLSLRLWDDVEVAQRPESIATIRIRDRGALVRLLGSPRTGFGDMYGAGRIEVEGDLVAALEATYRAIADSKRRRRTGLRQRRAPSRARSRSNVHHHYDLGNAFYELWLDREAMQYTCAYYPDSAMSLEQAQRAKLDHVCRKLWLAPGDRVVEAGCGWGGLALHMAREYGARVRAFNLSTEQIAYARERARRAGLLKQVEFVEDDYRNAHGPCEVFVSVGMLEHVGPGNYPELGRVIDRCLEPNGRGLIHSIGRDRPARLDAWIRKRIFPGAHAPTLREMAAVFEPAGLSVLDVENLRLHYARTLHHWLERFEGNFDRVRAMFDESFARAWRLYLAGSIAGFTTGTLQLFQVVFARSGAAGIPPSRRHVYDVPASTMDRA